MRKIAALIVGCCLIANAVQANQNVYFGGSLGQSFVETEVKDIEGDDFKLNENGFAYKIFAGARLSSQFALEGGYRSMGTVQSKVSDIEFESQMSGYDLHAIGMLNLVLFDLYAKAGVLFWDRQIEFFDIEESESGSNFSWGFGATVKLGTLGVRAEWERFELENYDRLSMLSVGLVYGL